METDIYILTDIKAPRRADGHYCYQIRCFDSKGNERTVWDRTGIQAFIISKASEYEAELTALRDALKRINKPCSLNIHLLNYYIEQGINSWSINWIANDWLTSANKPVANADLWKEVLELLSTHEYTFLVEESHEYKKVMESAIKQSKQ